MNGRKARQLRKENNKPVKVKVPTPPENRSFVTNDVPGPGGTKYASYGKPRSEKSVKRFLEQFDPAPAKTE